MSSTKKRKPENDKDASSDSGENNERKSSKAQKTKNTFGPKKKRSTTWQHFTVVEKNLVQCHYCDRRLKYHNSTTGMNAHIRVCPKFEKGDEEEISTLRQMTLPSLAQSAETRKDDLTKAFVMNGIAYRVSNL